MNFHKLSAHRYSDKPRKYSNPLLGSLQLIFWIYIHPSAWRNFVNSLNSDLSPEFRLSDLNSTQWKNKSIQNILLQGQIIAPVIIGTVWLLFCIGFLSNKSTDFKEAITFVIMVLFGSLSVCITSSIVIGFAVGIAGGCAICLFGGLAAFIPSSLNSHIGVESLAIAIGVAGGGVSGGAAIGLINSFDKKNFNKQFSGILIGIIFGAFTGLFSGIVGAGLSIKTDVTLNIGLQLGKAFALSIDKNYFLVLALALIISCYLNSKNWKKNFILYFIPLISFVFAILILKNNSNKLEYNLFECLYFGASTGLANGVIFSTLFGLSGAIAERIGGRLSGAIAGAISSAGLWFAFLAYSKPSIWITGLLLIGAALSLSFWRPILFYPLTFIYNLILYRLDLNSNSNSLFYLQYHSAFWDEHQILPLIGLDVHVTMVYRKNSNEGKKAINYLSTSRQRWAAQAAQIEIDAINFESCTGLFDIAQTHKIYMGSELENTADAHFRFFSRISKDIEVSLNQKSVYHRRLILNNLNDRLDGFIRELTRNSDKLSKRCRPIAVHWASLVELQVHEIAHSVEISHEILNPYIIGVPLSDGQEVFVGREDICSRIEKLILDECSPPLLLYGQRRTGKTSLLFNLGRLLPTSIVPLFIDLQGPVSRSDSNNGFIYNLSKGIIQSAKRYRNLVLPQLARESLDDDPFTCFDDWLDEVEILLNDRIALIALDEFEVLSEVFNKNNLREENILGMFRNLIQHRQKFRFLFSGSHSFSELKSWSSYLINTQVIHISYLKESEATKLIELPENTEFKLSYTPQALQRVLDITNKHPFLLQLICSEIISLKNEQNLSNRGLVSIEDVELSIPIALANGRMFFIEIQFNQVAKVHINSVDLVRFIASHGERAIIPKSKLLMRYPHLSEETIMLLIRQEILEQISHGYRIQVELVRQWFCSPLSKG
jgi:hypothetical protein